MARDRHCDVTILGGGPAGTAAALHLARAGARVAVIDESRAAPPLRGETLPPEAAPLLAALNAAAAVGQGHAPCVANRSAWGSRSLHAREFVCNPFGSGWLLDRPVFDRALRQLAADAGALLLTARVRSAIRSNGSWRLEIDGAHAPAIVGPFAIDCTGRRATLATSIGVRRSCADRLVAAVVALPPDARDEDRTVLIEAVEHGWWYTARHPRGARLLMLMTDADIAGALRARDGDLWLAGLLRATEHIAALVGTNRDEHLLRPRLCAAATSRLLQTSGEGWVAAGDSLMTLDPVSSYGISSALLFGRRAAAAALDGSRQAALDEYDTVASDAFARFLEARGRCYAQERRWPAAPFWQRRHGGRGATGRVGDALLR